MGAQGGCPVWRYDVQIRAEWAVKLIILGYMHPPCIHPYPFLMQGVSSRAHGEQLYCRLIVCRGYNIIPLVLGRLGPRLRGQ